MDRKFEPKFCFTALFMRHSKEHETSEKPRNAMIRLAPDADQNKTMELLLRCINVVSLRACEGWLDPICTKSLNIAHLYTLQSALGSNFQSSLLTMIWHLTPCWVSEEKIFMWRSYFAFHKNIKSDNLHPIRVFLFPMPRICRWDFKNVL